MLSHNSILTKRLMAKYSAMNNRIDSQASKALESERSTNKRTETKTEYHELLHPNLIG